ncbi:hypothetical protein ACFV4P_34195 [Kitasatospora sp. NPDC059795]|uniref:hypothetical protein n=1 Tax=Kitasatospora sp. NPDC059795 TaxID=3346949 RepID=UPI0036578257
MPDLPTVPVPRDALPPLPLPRSDYLVVLSWTLEGGGDIDEVCLIARRYDPDVVALGKLDTDHIDVAAQKLRMDAYPSATTPVTRHRNALFTRPAGVLNHGLNHRNANARDPRVPRVSVTFKVRSAAGALEAGLFSVTGVHLSRHSPAERLLMAESLNHLPGNMCRLVVGAFNEDAVGEQEEIDRSTGPGRAHWHDRSHHVHGIGRIAATRVHEALSAQGLVDVARVVGTEEAMRPTGSVLLPVDGRRAGDRDCRVYADLRTAASAVHLEVLAGYDDVATHLPILTVLHLPTLRAGVAASSEEHSAARKRSATERAAWKAQRIAHESARGLR